MKIKKSLVEQIIKEEAVKIKELIDLNEEKNVILKQLNGLYENKELTTLKEEREAIQKQLNELYEEEELEEGLFGFGTNWKDPQEVQQKFIAFWDKKFQDPKFRKLQRPEWSVNPENEMFQKALQAAMQYKTFDIYWHPSKHEFLAKQFSTKGHTFGGGAGMEEGEKLDELFGFGGGNKGVSREEAMQIIQQHPGKRKAYQQISSKSPEKGEKFVEFLMANPKNKSMKWDNAKNSFVDASKYSVAGHTFGGGAGMEESCSKDSK